MTSFRMAREFPILISACMSLPPGPTLRLIASAPSAFLYQSIVCAALSRVSCVVIVWYPSGTGFAAFAIRTSSRNTVLDATGGLPRSCHYRPHLGQMQAERRTSRAGAERRQRRLRFEDAL